MTAAVSVIDWNTILETYGPEAKIALTKLLADAGLEDTDSAALVIAAMFISQIDSNLAFKSITATIDSGKAQLSDQFEEQILKLRGVVTYAEEHLVQTNAERANKLNSEILDVIKQGVAKAIGREGKSRHKRATMTTSATMVCASILTIVSLAVGAMGVYSIMAEDNNQEPPVTEEQLESFENGTLWLEVAKLNQENMNNCFENSQVLEHRCIVVLP